MSLTLSLAVCTAMLMVLFRSKLITARAGIRGRHDARVSSLIKAGSIAIGLAFCFVTTTAAQEAASTTDSHGIANDEKGSAQCDELAASSSAADSGRDADDDRDRVKCGTKPAMPSLLNPNTI